MAFETNFEYKNNINLIISTSNLYVKHKTW